MRVLGLDVGEKRIGVAVCDELGLTAQGIGVIKRNGLNQDLKSIENLIKQYNVSKIVIGIPKNMNGSLGPQGESVRKFGENIRRNLKISIEYWDERLTTVEAERTLINADLSRKKRKRVIDKLAAVLILQSYLDCKSDVDMG